MLVYQRRDIETDYAIKAPGAVFFLDGDCVVQVANMIETMQTSRALVCICERGLVVLVDKKGTTVCNSEIDYDDIAVIRMNEE